MTTSRSKAGWVTGRGGCCAVSAGETACKSALEETNSVEMEARARELTERDQAMTARTGAPFETFGGDVQRWPPRHASPKCSDDKPAQRTGRCGKPLK